MKQSVVLRAVTSLAVAGVLCVIMCGCCVTFLQPPDRDTPIEPSTITTAVPEVEMPWRLMPNGHAYSTLNSEQQANYDEIVRQLYDNRGKYTYVANEPGLSVTLPHPCSEQKDLLILSQAVLYDHPELFWLKNQYGGTQIGESYVSIRFIYLWDASERAARAAELEEEVAELVASCTAQSDAEKALFFHDALLERCEYNQEVADEDAESGTASQARFESLTAYAALCEGNPICEGYTDAFHLLLNCVGIKNTPVVNEDHMWSLIWLDDEPYHVDVTWDDDEDITDAHRYFNLTDDEIRASREYPAQDFAVPDATATTYNYYAMMGCYFTDPYDEALGDCIREQILQGKETVDLKFSPDVYQEAFDHLLEGEAFFDAVYELEDDTLRDEWYNTIYYYDNEELCTLSIFLEEEE